MEVAIPHLRILDYDKAVAFYVDALGFEIDFEWRNGPGLPRWPHGRMRPVYVTEPGGVIDCSACSVRTVAQLGGG